MIFILKIALSVTYRRENAVAEFHGQLTLLTTEITISEHASLSDKNLTMSRNYLDGTSPDLWSLDSFAEWCLKNKRFSGEKTKVLDYMRKELEGIANSTHDDSTRARAEELLGNLQASDFLLYLFIFYRKGLISQLG